MIPSPHGKAIDDFLIILEIEEVNLTGESIA